MSNMDNDELSKDNIEIIYNFYKKELSVYALLYKHIWFPTILFITSILLYMVGVVTIIIFFDEEMFVLAVLGVLISVIPTSIFLKSQSEKYIRGNFGLGRSRLLKISDAIQKLQYKKMKEKLDELHYDSSEKIDDLIDHLDTTTEKTKLEQLLPFSILALLILPIWNGYVDFRYNVLLGSQETASVYTEVFHVILSLFVIGGIVIWLPAYLIVVFIRSILLFKFNRQYDLCNMLRRISHNLKKNA